jgi:hypothetical protein
MLPAVLLLQHTGGEGGENSPDRCDAVNVSSVRFSPPSVLTPFTNYSGSV